MIDSSDPRRGLRLRAALAEDEAMPPLLAAALVSLASDLTRLNDIAQVADLQERARVLLVKLKRRPTA